MDQYENNDISYLKECKKQIEVKLNWSPSANWKQRDYLNLIDLIEKASGISISLSTIKRIWNPTYNGRPQRSTLDALAIFLGYKEWLDFKSAQKLPKTTTTDNSTAKATINPKWLLYISLPLICLVAFLVVKSNFQKPVEKSASSVSIKSTVSSNVPNTVVFTYDIDDQIKDSVFLQQSWNDREKVFIDSRDSILTRTYFYPGAHRVKLISNNEVIAKNYLKINTDSWIGLWRNGNKDIYPTYLDLDTLNADGLLKTTENELAKNNVELNQGLILSYFYITDFNAIDSENFRFKIRLKNENYIKSTCPSMYIGLLGSESAHFIPLTKPGCIGEINLMLGKRLIDGRTNDLSNFGVDFYAWHEVEMIKEGSQCSIFINGNSIHTSTGVEDIGEFAGFMINFAGLGVIDYVLVEHPKTGEILYKEDFE